MMWFHHLVNFLLRILLRILLKLDICGVENMPSAGPLIVVINHTSFLDPLLVGAFLPRVIIPLAKVELFEKPWVGWVFPAFGCIPIRRGEIDRTAIRRSLEVLRSGGALLVAPEGTRSADGKLQRGRPGAAMLAVRTGAMLLPVAIWGVLPFGENIRRLRRTEAHMVVGEPFHLPLRGKKVTHQELEEMTDEIMYRLAELLPPEYRGVYRERQQLDMLREAGV